MQVHAVPESERAFDATGRQLPWGYEYPDNEHGQRRHVEERGPFGRATRRRGLSRSKTTGTPARKEDQAQAENTKYIDSIFTNLKTQPSSQDTAAAPAASTQTAAAPALAANQTPGAGEPTEVILYGFSTDTQWAAIAHYEKISGGIVYEDYDRHPPTSKYNVPLSTNRALAARSLSAAALKKKNTYSGGDHWIKVTFDSAEAADRACHYTPHTIHGHSVYAELYRGTGPQHGDIAIPPTHAAFNSIASSPTMSSATIRGSNASPNTSETASSATATGPSAPPTIRNRSAPSSFRSALTNDAAATTSSDASTGAFIQRPPGAPQAQPGTEPPAPPAPLAPLRVRGAKRAVLLPAEQALLPVGSFWSQMFGSWPILGLLFGGGTDVIGSEVPRTEDGSFDWATASFYWKVWAWIDAWLGTDFLGIGGDE
ncbi:uncharacterized protein K452DRAFT_330094 [Aplosporella prunicola CBS 121167]|uniref:RRM Nup35-type domain-containing protein n=1 Tax=Aplosporella prunicola CBS 121167 TaxID=1176127 RepID=A0A6A6AYU6_9PEZI|nr:uncharacterized protein K452DRAFT_330094 [Aplosporella prunicola CBS 121167]KAF2135681.1 hypothetical protein K452DRAFT_330094 [Aplosporella prunicola CBS 121167]